MKGGRRSFVKGSVAAPVVLTVGPAAARARSSSLACLKRDDDRAKHDPKKPDPMARVDIDDWLRVRVDLVQLTAWEGVSGTTVPGKHFLGIDKTTYWRLDEDLGGKATAVPTKYTAHNCSEHKLGEPRFALVYVDPDGHQTGYAFEKKGGTPVTGSCWTSLAVAKP